jgi:Membrane proteins related to metalloendopeptidases
MLNKLKFLILVLLIGLTANVAVASPFKDKIKNLFGHKNDKANYSVEKGIYKDYSNLPDISFFKNFSNIKSLEDIFFYCNSIVDISEDIRFSDFSELPQEYDIWHNTTINPYQVSLTNMKDTIYIDVSNFCPPSPKYVTSNFGFRRWKHHNGIDIKVHKGDTVKCAFDGTVRITRRERGYGYFVVVRHNNGLESLYGHLNKILVNQDSKIKAGDAIGMGGNTGRSTGYHLHLEFRYLGNPINPNDIIDFSNHTVKNDIFALSAENFGYKKEIDKIRYWTIKKGDTLGRIAHRTGVSISKLCSLNKIKRNTVLRIGRRIRYT